MARTSSFFSKYTLRKAIFFVHLWLGLIIGLYFAILGVTGSVLVFNEDLQASQVMPERSHVAPPTPDARLLPLSQIIEKLRPQFPEANDGEFAFVNPPATPDGAYLFRLTADKISQPTTVDPYTGQAIKRYPHKETWLDWIDDLHVNLLLKAPGKITNGYGGLLSCLLLLSGIWLWWPATVRQLKFRLSVKRGAGAPRIISDLHNVLGIYSLLLLFVVTLSGSVIVFYAPVQNIVTKVFGPAKMPRAPRLQAPENATRLPIETLMGIAEKEAPNAHFVFVMYPTVKNQVFYAYRRSETGILPDTRIYLDPYTGKQLQVGREITDPTTKKLMRSASGIHFGRWGGMPVKILYFVLGLVPLGLFVTGVLMYLRKRRSKAAQQKRKAILKAA